MHYTHANIGFSIIISNKYLGYNKNHRAFKHGNPEPLFNGTRHNEIQKLDVLSSSTVTLRPLSSTSRVSKNLRRGPVVGIVKNEKMSKKENIFPFCITKVILL